MKQLAQKLVNYQVKVTLTSTRTINNSETYWEIDNSIFCITM